MTAHNDTDIAQGYWSWSGNQKAPTELLISALYRLHNSSKCIWFKVEVFFTVSMVIIIY